MVRAALAALLLGAPARAVAQECRLALLLALDVSSSVSAPEDELQRGGLAAALTSPEVAAAFFEGPPVALAAYEWSGRRQQTVVLDWQLIDTPDRLEAAAARIAASTRSETAYPTAMGYALGYGVRMLEAGPPCLFRTIDVAGDGRNNEGFGPRQAYAAYPFEGVTVNGLLIESGTEPERAVLNAFYRNEVLRGPGAFLEIAQGYEDYARAMRRKLLRELQNFAIGGATRPEGAG